MSSEPFQKNQYDWKNINLGYIFIFVYRHIFQPQTPTHYPLLITHYSLIINH